MKKITTQPPSRFQQIEKLISEVKFAIEHLKSSGQSSPYDFTEVNQEIEEILEPVYLEHIL